jgi:hypothetical protein
MKMLVHLAGIVAAIILSTFFFAAPASAQATRTWISGVGDDANPCSRTAPCKTFAGAISKTAGGGEIDCLDPGGFGAVTITKSITLDCGGGIGGQAGSILTAGTNGIVVSAGATDIIKIRNMTINGVQKAGNPGLAGIKFLAGRELIVEHVGIFGFGSGGNSGTNGGVDFEPNGIARLSMNDVEIQYCLSDGVLIKPASGGSVTATLSHVSSLDNGGMGVRVDNANVTAGAGSNVTLWNSTISENADGVEVFASGSVPATVAVTSSVVSGNNNLGFRGAGTNATIVIGGSTVTGNATGVSANNSAIKTFQDNYFYNGPGGTSNGTPTGTISKF